MLKEPQVSGIHNTYVGRIERAKVNTSVDNIEKLAKGLGVDAGELLQFSSAKKAASERDEVLLELNALLGSKNTRTLRQIVRLVKDAFDLGR